MNRIASLAVRALCATAFFPAFARTISPATNAAATVKTVTWALPSGWDEGVSWSLTTNGYLRAWSPSLPKADEPSGAPEMPVRRIQMVVPAGYTVLDVSSSAAWEELNAGVAVYPTMRAGPDGPVFVPPDPAYYGLAEYPAEPAAARGVVTAAGINLLNIDVSPYKHVAAGRRLMRATSLVVTVRMAPPSGVTAAAARSTASAAISPALRALVAEGAVNPADASVSAVSAASTGSSADVVVISPPAFTNLWRKYVAYRSATHPGLSFTIKNTDEIYAAYTGADAALKLHHYIENAYANGTTYVILGAAAPGSGLALNTEREIPVRYAVGKNEYMNNTTIPSDLYYACMDYKGGAQVWDYDGDGVYLGSGSSGSYTLQDDGVTDWAPDLVVMRIPLQSFIWYSSKTATAEQMMIGYTNKLARAERADFSGRHSHALLAANKFFGYFDHGSTDSHFVDERRFFDGAVNMWDPAHVNATVVNSETCLRDRGYAIITAARGYNNAYLDNHVGGAVSYANLIAATNLDTVNVFAHGEAFEAYPASSELAWKCTGLAKFWHANIACDTGMMDYVRDGQTSTNSLYLAQAITMNPDGGGLVYYGNSRLGYWVGFDDYYSSVLDARLMSLEHGSTAWDAGGREWNAGMMLMKAKVGYSGSASTSFQSGSVQLALTGFGDPLVKISPQYDRTWNGAAGNLVWSRTDANWTLGMPDETVASRGTVAISNAVANAAGDISRNLLAVSSGSRAYTVAERLGAARLSLAGAAGDTITLAGTGSFRATVETVVTNANLAWNVGGGSGRYGVRFVNNAAAVLSVGGAAEKYFGTRFTNVGLLSVTGANTTVDFGNSGTDYMPRQLSFAAAGPDPAAVTNTLRKYGTVAIPASVRVGVVNGTLALNAQFTGGSAATAYTRDQPLFCLTNAVLVTRVNPYWAADQFSRPLVMNRSVLRNEYSSFALGIATASAPGFDILAAGGGTNRLESAVGFAVNGALRFAVDTNTVVDVAASLADGGYAGSVVKTGTGELVLRGSDALTGAAIVSNGLLRAMSAGAFGAAVVTVESNATLRLDALPLPSVSSLRVKNGGTLVLGTAAAAGVYRILAAPDGTGLVVESGARVYDASAPSVPLSGGATADGSYILSSAVKTWYRTTQQGVWSTSSSAVPWHDAAGNAVPFANGDAVAFVDLAGLSVSTVHVSGAVSPGYAGFSNASTAFVFVDSGSVSLASFAVGGPAAFEVPLVVSNGVRATGGRFAAADLVTPALNVASGATARVMAFRPLVGGVRYVRLSVSAVQSASEKPAVAEFRLYRGDASYAWPAGTTLADSSGSTATFTGSAFTGTSGNQEISALVDGIYGTSATSVTTNGITGQPKLNKWWPISQATGPWSVTFGLPADEAPFTGYDFCLADTATRNPKSWTVAVGRTTNDMTVVATVSDRALSGANVWIGGGSAAAFDAPSGAVAVAANGALELAGVYTNITVTLAADAVLKVTGADRLLLAGEGGLVLPASGTVAVDVSAAVLRSTPFPVLAGANLSEYDLARFSLVGGADAALVVSNGVLCVVTSGVMAPPYARTLDADAANWFGESGWTGNGVAFPAAWENVGTYPGSNVVLTLSGARARTVFTATNYLRIGTLRLAEAATRPDAFELAGGASNFVAKALDLSACTGTSTLSLGLGSANVVAGTRTIISNAAANAGTLTVPAGAEATLAAAATVFASYANSGTIRAMGARGSISAIGSSGTVEYENATVACNRNGNYTVLSRDGDVVNIVGGGDYGVGANDWAFNVSGGSVTVGDGSNYAWVGSDRTYVVTGGVLAFNYYGAGDNNDGLVVGWSGQTTANVSGGRFRVKSGALSTYNGYSINLSGTGIAEIKGFRTQSARGSVNIAAGSALLVGSLGATASSVALNLNGGMLAAYASCGIAAPVTLGAAGSVLAATNGTTLAVTGVISGSSAFALGSTDFAGAVNLAAANTCSGPVTVAAGVVTPGNASALGSGAVTVAGGTLVLPSAAYVANTIVPAGGTVRVALSRAQLAFTLPIALFATTANASALASGVTVVDPSGATVAGTFSVANGSALFSPTASSATVITEATPAAAFSAGADAVQLVGLSSGSIAVSGAVTCGAVASSGEEVTLAFAAGASLAATNGFDFSRAPVRIDAGDIVLPAEASTNWLLRGAVAGTVRIGSTPAAPAGYAVAFETVPAEGVRLVVAARARKPASTVFVTFGIEADNAASRTVASTNGISYVRLGASDYDATSAVTGLSLVDSTGADAGLSFAYYGGSAGDGGMVDTLSGVTAGNANWTALTNVWDASLGLVRGSGASGNGGELQVASPAATGSYVTFGGLVVGRAYDLYFLGSRGNNIAAGATTYTLAEGAAVDDAAVVASVSTGAVAAVTAAKAITARTASGASKSGSEWACGRFSFTATATSVKLTAVGGQGCINALKLVAYSSSAAAWTGTVVSASAAWSTKEGLDQNAAWNDGGALVLFNTNVASTLTFDSPVTAATFVVAAATKDLALASGATVPAVGSYDFSGAAARVTVGFATGSAGAAAGSGTVFTASGAGTLTIGAGKNAVLSGFGAWGGTVAGDAAGTLTRLNAGPLSEIAQATYTNVYSGASTVVAYNSSVNLANNVVFKNGASWTSAHSTSVTDPTAGQTNESATQPGLRLRSGRLALESGAKFSMPTGYVEMAWDNLSAANQSGELSLSGTGTVMTVRGFGGGNTSDSERPIYVSDGAKLVIGGMGCVYVANGMSYRFYLNGGTIAAAADFGVKGDQVRMTLNANGGTFDPATNTITWSQPIGGAGALTLDSSASSGRLVLSGANTFSGGTVVKAGTLVVSNAAALASGSVALAGGTLDLGTFRLKTGTLSSGGGTLAARISNIEASSSVATALLPVTGESATNGLVFAFTDAAGATLAAGSYSLAIKNGVLYYVPSGASILTPPFALDLTANSSSGWTTANWKDVGGSAVPAGIWSSTVSAARMTVPGGVSAAFAADTAISVSRMTVTNAGSLVWTAGTGGLSFGTGLYLSNSGTFIATLAAVGAVDDSASTGSTTILGVAPSSVLAGANTVVVIPPASATIAAGKMLTISNDVDRIVTPGGISNSGGTLMKKGTGTWRWDTTTPAAVNVNQGTFHYLSTAGSDATRTTMLPTSGTVLSGTGHLRLQFNSGFSQVAAGTTISVTAGAKVVFDSDNVSGKRTWANGGNVTVNCGSNSSLSFGVSLGYWDGYAMDLAFQPLDSAVDAVVNYQVSGGYHNVTVGSGIRLNVASGVTVGTANRTCTVQSGGTLAGTGTVAGATTINSGATVVAGLAFSKSLALASGAMIDARANGAALAAPSAFTAAGTITVDVTGRTDLKGGLRLVSWSAVPDGTFVLKGTASRTVSKRADGLYIDEVFYLRVVDAAGDLSVSNNWIFAKFPAASSLTDLTNVLEAVHANGITGWQSYVLGLDPTNGESRIVCDAAQDAQTGSVTLSVRNVAVNGSAGATVRYILQSRASAAEEWADVEEKNSSSFAIPLSDVSMRFYRVKTLITL